MENHYSLFEYLGRPAGSALGKEVFLVSKFKKIPIAFRDVHTRKYSGKICLYPLDFLEWYFSYYV